MVYSTYCVMVGTSIHSKVNMIIILTVSYVNITRTVITN